LGPVLTTARRYLEVVRKLILTYTLEPAGSHGVWGLDDHSFAPYIFGSAQLTRPIADDEPLPQEGSAPRAPKPADVLKADAVAAQRELNMYFAAVGFINDVKKGPFWEHSPILFDVSGIKDGWGKINKVRTQAPFWGHVPSSAHPPGAVVGCRGLTRRQGMIKMYNAEVLAKFPVVQHFPFGSLFSWDPDPDAAPPAPSVHMVNQPAAAPGGAGTAAPWAQATRMPGPPGPGIPYSRVPGAASVPSGSRLPPPPGLTAAQGGGPPGTASAQIALTKAPWAKD